MEALGTWRGEDKKLGFPMVKRPNGDVLNVANLVEDDPNKRGRAEHA
jgi:hypothetical protein